MNKLYIIGNVTHTPELKNTPNGVPVCSFSVAVNRRDKDALFYRVTAWRGLGETCAKYLQKGKKVAVIGELDLRIYTGRDGMEKTALEVTASDVEFLSPRSDDQQQPQQQVPEPELGGFIEVTGDDQQQPQQQVPEPELGGFIEVTGDDANLLF